jgi:serine/threonine protein kinase
MSNINKIAGYSIDLDKKLGKGSFGKVYVGYSDNNGMKVAVKCLERKQSNLML